MSLPVPKKILVVGAGLGGLAAAIRLAAAGHSVELWEKNAEPGGKLKELRIDGFTWGTGPSLLTLPEVLRELFTAAGHRLENYLELRRLESCCRYFWSDGTQMDEDAAFWARPEVADFLRYARGIYELSGEAFLRRPPGEFWRAFSPRHWAKLRHLGKVATTRTLAREVERRLRDPYLRQIFLRFATYNGSSPYETPATFNIIPFVEAEFGGWYITGGLPRLSHVLAGLAEKLGVRFCFGRTLIFWRDGEARAAEGTQTRADRLICNADALTARTTFLAADNPPCTQDRLTQSPLSSSGFILFLGVRGQDARLQHHNIFFSDDYPREFQEIHRDRIAPREPTIYLAISARSDPAQAPAAHDNYFLLVNAPARDPRSPWTKSETAAYRDLVLARLATFGLADLPGRIVAERCFTPSDFATRDLAYHGALYGWASHSVRTALFRPAQRGPRGSGIYFVGGTTHPGGGIPLVLLSAQMVASAIEKEPA